MLRKLGDGAFGTVSFPHTIGLISKHYQSSYQCTIESESGMIFTHTGLCWRIGHCWKWHE
jgi:hypothetical protein